MNLPAEVVQYENSASIPVLMFHSVGPQSDTLTVDPARLRTFLAALLAGGYEVVGLSEALGRPAARVVALTFDDAMADFLTHAMPVLTELGCRASLYAPVAHLGGVADWKAGPMSGRPLLDWSGLGEVVAAGHEVGAHGLKHVPLDVLPEHVVRDHARRAKAELEGHLGVPVVSFAYPHGYAAPSTARAVRACGYRNACVIGYRRHPLNDDPMRVNRLTLHPRRDPVELARSIADCRPSVVARVKSVGSPGWRTARRVLRRMGKEVT